MLLFGTFLIALLSYIQHFTAFH
ncbi:putative holin-like toxin [Loigolactobacillus backii]|nr:putative holin-like toxin [Loigolactobacillus backii]